MVYVRMGQNKYVHLFRVKTEAAVQYICLFAHALEHAAIEEDLFAVGQCEEVFAASDCSCGTVECYFHDFIFWRDAF